MNEKKLVKKAAQSIVSTKNLYYSDETVVILKLWKNLCRLVLCLKLQVAHI